ncbi:MAG TPA: Hpt domain-containing protein [Steroidobacteraceae bacterium]|nr:Hpt domain-containing protein [Steroidobacteraceae bacterium]HRX88624.1 Hpt domain-containing protein [Steroidobacteraceae bacterium]
MSEVAMQTLDLVGREINHSLNEARNALETYVEQQENISLLERCSADLHQIQGVLRVLEIYGAALLAEEMEHVSHYLHSASARKNQAEALDALMRAMVQLPGYLERVLAGGRDLALVLLPLLNDLRAVRGSPLLSEGTLLLLNLKSDKQAAPAAGGGDEALTAAQWARKLRARFQVGLIGWIRGERTEQNLDILTAVSHQLEQVATTQPVFQLWWVVGAVLEALREDGLEAGVSVKRLLGLADREILRLYKVGEARYAQTPSVDLLNNLLYYVARATSTGPRITAVRASFRLGELLPVDDSIEQERENLSAPSIKLMQTVAAAIREDLGKIKDVLDIFVRRGGQGAELEPQLAMLRKIGDTLGVLGLGELRARVLAETTRLESIVGGEAPADHAALVQIAATLINVEDRLDRDLVGLIVPKTGAPGAEVGGGDVDFQQVQAAVLRECSVNLVRIKEAISQNVSGTLDAAALDSWPDLLRGIKAGLLMLGKSRAVDIIDRIGQHLKNMLQPGSMVAPTSYLDRLADAIVSVEYYMETLQAGRADPWYMLDNAETCLEALANLPRRTVPTVAPVGPEAFAATVKLEPTEIDDGEVLLTDVATAGLDLPVLSRTMTRADLPPEPVDPDLLALFIEEAREEVAKIGRLFPEWDANPLALDALADVRRAFHTLKGSGRMVGALDVADFAWSIENLINRILENTLARSQEILVTLREAVAIAPQLVDALAANSAPPAAVAPVIDRAHALAAGKPVDARVAATGRVKAAESRLDADTASSIASGEFATNTSTLTLDAAELDAPIGANADTGINRSLQPRSVDGPSGGMQLNEIYVRETATHVAAVRAFIAYERDRSEPHAVSEAVYRACHTLTGSSRMAEVRQGIRLMAPCDHWLRKAFDSGVGIETADLDLLEQCMDAMESVANNLDENTGFFVSHIALVERIALAERTLDRRIVDASQQIDIGGFLVDEDTTSDEAASATVVATETPAPADADDDDLLTDFDPEIAGIFTDEATELIDSAEGALAAWNSDRGDSGNLLALKRPLHTLKGGARMAGITPMGDLAHELETLVMQIESGIVPADDAAYSVAQSSLDELARMRELVVAGSGIPSGRRLIERIRALSQPRPSTAAQAAEQPWVETEVLPEPEPEAEPEPEPETATEPQSEYESIEILAEDDAEIDFEVGPELLAEGAAAVPVADTTSAGPDSISTEFVDLSEPAEVVQQPPAADLVERPAAREQAGLSWVGRTGENDMPAPAPVPPGREPVAQVDRPELARVDAELLDQLLNSSGEASIARARLEQQMGSIDFNVGELSRTVARLKEQLRKLEIETEAQILHRYEEEGGARGDFDPLELDRYSAIQQYSRALAETANDVASIQQLLETMTKDTHGLLQQQARTITELQNGLMRTRMVPFQRHVQRLSRIVRQAASDSGKRAELIVEGAAGELDRQVLERMLPPFEHMLRNAVVHGIELPDERRARDKPETGRITVSLHREGSEVVVEVADDGAGMNLRAIRDKGVALGMIHKEQQLSDADVIQLVLEPGFSTAGTVTQSAGRGVGMDVVATEIKKLGGALHMETREHEGSRFTIRLPLTLAISHALILRTADEFYALPLPTVDGVVRLARSEVAAHLGSDAEPFDYGGQKYRFQHLAMYIGREPSPLPDNDVTVPVVLVRAGEHSTGLIADELVGSREIVVKSVGPQIAAIRGISGATILGDGRIVVILDIGALVRADWRLRSEAMLPREKTDSRTFVLVVDDSITVRRVTQRLLERNDMRVLTARDGVDAMEVLAENTPDIILLDIEMPRMDGYEVAGQVRNDPRLADVPIIMITSRVGEKHRARAIELGVDDYLGKPYQEAQLLEAIEPLVQRRRSKRAGH